MLSTKEYKIMSFNIQSCRDYVTRAFTPLTAARAINELKPDIVGLNEVRGLPFLETTDPSWFDQIKELSKLTNLPYCYFGVAINLKGPYGNAILSKFPLKNVKTIPIPDPIVKDEDAYYESRCIISCDIEELHIFVTHIGLAKSEQRNGINLLKELIKKTEGPTILMGDFNMTPDNSLIQEIKELLFDTATVFKKPLLSFPSINPRIKIDYIFTSKDIKVIEANIPEIIASDHFPYYTIIKINK